MARKLLISMAKQGLFVGAKDQQNYETKKNEFVVIVIMTKACEVKILFPPREGQADRFNKQFKFGDLIDVNAIADIRDIQVSIYKDELSVKILADYLKED